MRWGHHCFLWLQRGSCWEAMLASKSLSLNVLFLCTPHQLARDILSQDTKVDASGCNEMHSWDQIYISSRQGFVFLFLFFCPYCSSSLLYLLFIPPPRPPPAKCGDTVPSSSVFNQVGRAEGKIGKNNTKIRDLCSVNVFLLLKAASRLVSPAPENWNLSGSAATEKSREWQLASPSWEQVPMNLVLQHQEYLVHSNISNKSTKSTDLQKLWAFWWFFHKIPFLMWNS